MGLGAFGYFFCGFGLRGCGRGVWIWPMRRTPQQRIEAYRAKAAELAERESRRVLRNSPQWRATRTAIEKIDEALILLATAGSGDAEHRAALEQASAALDGIAQERI